MKIKILISFLLIVGVLLSGCIENNHEPITYYSTEYPLVAVQTTHKSDLLDSCDYTVAYYGNITEDLKDLKTIPVKPCFIGVRTPKIHIINDSDIERIIVVTAKNENGNKFDYYASDIYIRKETFASKSFVS